MRATLGMVIGCEGGLRQVPRGRIDLDNSHAR